MKSNHRSWVSVLVLWALAFTTLTSCNKEEKRQLKDAAGIMAEQGDADTATGLQILVDEEELSVQYGQYTEFELTLSQTVAGPVTWETPEENMPEGLFLEESQGAKILVFGTPRFTDRWCT